MTLLCTSTYYIPCPDLLTYLVTPSHSHFHFHPTPPHPTPLSAAPGNLVTHTLTTLASPFTGSPPTPTPTPAPGDNNSRGEKRRKRRPVRHASPPSPSGNVTPTSPTTAPATAATTAAATTATTTATAAAATNRMSSEDHEETATWLFGKVDNSSPETGNSSSVLGPFSPFYYLPLPFDFSTTGETTEAQSPMASEPLVAQGSRSVSVTASVPTPAPEPAAVPAPVSSSALIRMTKTETRAGTVTKADVGVGVRPEDFGLTLVPSPSFALSRAGGGVGKGGVVGGVGMDGGLSVDGGGTVAVRLDRVLTMESRRDEDIHTTLPSHLSHPTHTSHLSHPSTTAAAAHLRIAQLECEVDALRTVLLVAQIHNDTLLVGDGR